MGKQAKKKQKTEGQLKGQRTHNRNTKGVNTTKRGPVWSIRQRKVKDSDGKEIIQTYNVRVPVDALWSPDDKQRNSENAPEPFDALQLDWKEELMEYAAEKNAKVASLPIGNGRFLHRVFEGENPEKPKRILLEVSSEQTLMLENFTRGPKRRSRKKA